MYPNLEVRKNAVALSQIAWEHTHDPKCECQRLVVWLSIGNAHCLDSVYHLVNMTQLDQVDQEVVGLPGHRQVAVVEDLSKNLPMWLFSVCWLANGH